MREICNASGHAAPEGIRLSTFDAHFHLSKQLAPSREADRQRIRLTDRAFRLACIQDDTEFALAANLIEQRYAWRGYQIENEALFERPSNQVTFAAYQGESVVGTLTLRTDSSHGLLADELYQDDIDWYRTHRNAHCCELTRFALAPTRQSKEVFASLFHLAFIFGREIHQVSDVFIEVNPRHVSFYHRMLGLGQVGTERICKRVAAPAVLMHGDLSHIETQIDEHGGSPYLRAKSLYPYFFSKQEALSVIEQLRWTQ
ncbi:long-chain N-acyl amino acid synthase [Uliginosibacterium sp. H3]|uniref:Long-chain N-acyl amino acid synthase n=1 Tax=Uliginosibacterium silvisoli TaxID=3114758 RepID=A0ABU6K7J7_9RHOO|nr:long-chain N-acyl amino acid synthase [Uliginosibacterium sp. H3]